MTTLMETFDTLQQQQQQQSNIANISMETDKTWDLIAEASKNENNNVFRMILEYYKGSFQLDEKQYQSCPIETFASLFQQKPFIKLFRGVCDIGSYSWSAVDDETDSEDETSATASSKKKKDKKKDKNKKKKKTTNTADQIREKKIINDFKETIPFVLSGEFYNQEFKIVESIILHYISVVNNSYSEQNGEDFINALLSLRDSFDCFMSYLHPNFCDIVRRVLNHYGSKFPWKTFFKQFTKFLIKNHFTQTYQRATKPFPEQAEFIDLLKQSHRRLFVLPWGVGCGKTASVSPVSYILNSCYGMQTFYCVPLGPVRDQTAANLYRCGIPFAYISQTGPQEFELQPSFLCSYTKQPYVFIVETAFMEYYIRYWKSFLTLLFGEDGCEDVSDLSTIDVSENPPAIRIPRKKRYAHITQNVWKYPFALIIDEPCDNDRHLGYIFNHLPETSVILSATSCHLVNEEVRQNYLEHNYNGSIVTVNAQTIGVSTTLIGYWLEDSPVISPFSGIKTREEFKAMTERISTSILWRRFMSPMVLVEWIEKIKPLLPEGTLNHSFDLLTISYDQISKRLIDWTKTIYQTIMDDGWYEATFRLGNSRGLSSSEILHNILEHKSYQFTGGCIIASPSIYRLYEMTDFLISRIPQVSDVKHTIEAHRRQIYGKFKDIMKITYNRDNLHTKNDLLSELMNAQMKCIPIQPEMVINTPEYIKKHSNDEYKTYSKNIRFSLLHPLTVEGELNENDPEEWKIYVDVIDGVDEDYMRYKWVGLGSILDNKEFYMKSIRDSDSGIVSYLGVDHLGAYGLNLKITNAVLFEDDDSATHLTTGECLQMAGRVGRIGQESSGFVYITSEKLFKKLLGN